LAIVSGWILLHLSMGPADLVAQRTTVYAEAPAPDRYAEAIDFGRAIMTAIGEYSGTPGMSVAVAIDGKVVWSEGFGYADVENRVPVWEETKFRIGSVSKPLTMLGPIVKFDIDALVQDIQSKHETYKTRTFVNIDPNTACYDLERFLQTIIKQKVDIDLYFFGGIQPDFVTKQLVALMKQANVKGISLPRELDNRLNMRLNKKYTANDFYNAIRLFENEHYDLSAFHCPFPVALQDDDLTDILLIIKEIRNLGAIAEISPIAFVPGTAEYDNHYDLLQGKNLEELNWALWPTLDSIEKIRTYSLVYNMAHNYRFVDPWPI